jgi:starch phosphorylase
MAYDTPVIGYNTFNTNCLRLWSALPSFDSRNKEYHCQTDDDYVNLVKTRQRAERITSVLFYKDMLISNEMQEDIIKQQYFFCAASIKDVIRRYKKTHKSDFEQLPQKIAI